VEWALVEVVRLFLEYVEGEVFWPKRRWKKEKEVLRALTFGYQSQGGNSIFFIAFGRMEHYFSLDVILHITPWIGLNEYHSLMLVSRHFKQFTNLNWLHKTLYINTYLPSIAPQLPKQPERVENISSCSSHDTTIAIQKISRARKKRKFTHNFKINGERRGRDWVSLLKQRASLQKQSRKNPKMQKVYRIFIETMIGLIEANEGNEQVKYELSWLKEGTVIEEFEESKGGKSCFSLWVIFTPGVVSEENGGVIKVQHTYNRQSFAEDSITDCESEVIQFHDRWEWNTLIADKTGYLQPFTGLHSALGLRGAGIQILQQFLYALTGKRSMTISVNCWESEQF